VATVEQALLGAQRKAEDLFAKVVDTGLIRPGVLESELSREIHELAKRDFGLRRHWHKRVVRAGPNTVLTYHAEPPDRRLAQDDVVYLDFGPLFDEWEADYGRTYVLGNDPLKHKLVADIETAFKRGKQRFMDDTELTAGGLYDYVSGLAKEAAWDISRMRQRPAISRDSPSATAIPSACASRMRRASVGTGSWKYTSRMQHAPSVASAKSC
jgi:Xaa-Pro dipeptidase